MAWTYSSDDLDTATSAGQLNVVRLLVGDTDTLDQQVQDAEVEFALAQSNSNVYSAASWCATVVAAKYARRVTSQLDGALQADYSDLQKHYTTLSEQLDSQSKKYNSTLGVSAGGISKVVMETVRNSPIRPTPSFTRDRFKYPPAEDDVYFNYE